MMPGVYSMTNKRRKLQLSVCARAWSRRRLPYFYVPTKTYRKVVTRLGEGQRGDSPPEGEVVQRESTREARKDCPTIFVH